MLTRRLTSVLLLPFALALVGADGSCSFTADELGGTPPPAEAPPPAPTDPTGTTGVPSGAVVTVSPTTIHLPKGGQFHFAASVTVHTDQSFVWSMHPSTPGGVFGAPDSGAFTAPQRAGEYWVVATAIGGSGETVQAAGVAKVVVDEVFIAVSPPAAIVNPGGELRLTSTLVGADDTRVVWSIAEGGLAHGTINAAGVYTAPMGGGGLLPPFTATIRATSIAHPSVRATATVTVSTADAMSVTLCPAVTTLVTGETIDFAATVTPTPGVAGIDWSIVPIGNNWTGGSRIEPTGEYTARLRAGPDAGTFKVRATAKADPSKFVEGTVSIVNKADRVVRGAVNYGGSATGPTYVFGELSSASVATTSGTAPVLFNLRGETPATSARSVAACRSTLGTGKCVYAADPMGIGTIPAGRSNTDAFVNVTLADPPTVASLSTPSLPAGSVHSVTVVGTAIIVRFNPLVADEGTWKKVERADKYRVKLDEDELMGTPETKTVKAGLRPVAIFSDLAPDDYYVTVENQRGSYSSPPSSVVSRTIPTATTGHAISGNLDLTGLPLTTTPLSRVYVLVVPDQPASQVFGYGTRLLTAGADDTNDFNIYDVPDGTYRFEVLVDLDGDGVLDGDSAGSDPWGPTTKYVTMSGAAVPGQDLAVAASDLHVRAVSHVDEHGAQHLRFSATSNLARIESAAVTAGPSSTASRIQAPADLRLPWGASSELDPDEAITPGGRFTRRFALGGTSLPVGPAFPYTLNYTVRNGPTCATSVAVEGEQAPVTNLTYSLAGTVASYTWTPASGASHYRVRVTKVESGGERTLVNGAFLDGAAVAFAPGTTLADEVKHEVEVVAFDGNGNSALDVETFTP